MRRSGLTSLIAFVVIVVGLLVGVLAAGWKPLLGLDLQGGVAVVLKPTKAADAQQINQAVEIIRKRVDAIGVAEPDITTQGGNVVVQLPGVKDRERALQLVGSTAELRFRPVLSGFNPPVAADQTTSTTSAISLDGVTTTTADASSAGSTTSVSAGSTTTGSTTSGSTTTGSTTTTAAVSGNQSLGAETGVASGEYALGPLRQETTTTTPATTTPATTETTVAATTDTSTVPAAATDPLSSLTSLDITPRDKDLNEDTVVLPQLDRKTGLETVRYALGPTLVKGDALVAADTKANLNPQTGEWFVQINFKDGDENVGAWRVAVAACVNKESLCPTGNLAAVLDGVVISAPTISPDLLNSTSNGAIVTGNFNQKEAENLAQQLRYGALPVQFERQQSQDVSATVGRDALRAGVAAGLIGLGLVAIYILVFYRILGLVALASLTLSFGLLWSIISWLGATQGLALSLSGVVGIIVSIGISIDSNIVYFEQIKDDMVGGRNLRSSAQRAFQGAMSTIIKADLVSLIAAGLLYWLTVGAVKGFALYLGLSTLLDLVASYFFMRPAVVWLSRTRLAAERPSVFGIRESHGHVLAKAAP